MIEMFIGKDQRKIHYANNKIFETCTFEKSCPVVMGRWRFWAPESIDLGTAMNPWLLDGMIFCLVLIEGLVLDVRTQRKVFIVRGHLKLRGSRVTALDTGFLMVHDYVSI
jgi:hypothetical protein